MRRADALLVGIGITLASALGALGWLYTRPAMDAEEIASIRARGQALVAPRPSVAGTVAPAFTCAPFSRTHQTVARGRVFGEEPSETEMAELARSASPCRDGLDAAWHHELLANDASVDDVVAGVGSLVSEARGADAPEAAMEASLRGIWAVDGIVRAGRLDLTATGMLGLRAMSLTNLHLMRPLTEAEASRVREQLERVRAHHPRRLARPELLILGDADLMAPGSAVSGEQALAWVCTEQRVALAERLAALGCGSLTTHECFTRVMAEADAVEVHEPPPPWTPLLPPRVRRGHDARCPPLAEQLRERARGAVVAEVAFALIDEAILHSLEGHVLERAMLRPVPTFEGEPVVRVLEEAHDETFEFGDGRRGTGRVDAVVHLQPPAWVGAAASEDALVLYPRHERRAP